METSDELHFDRGPETPKRLKTQLSRLVGMSAVQMGRVACDALRAVNARKDHFVVLAALDEFGPASQAALSRRTRIYTSDLVSVLNDLASGGWVSREADASDKRRKIVSITDTGESRLAELAAILDGVNDHIMAPLNHAERRQLFALLGRVNAHLADSAVRD